MRIFTILLVAVFFFYNAAFTQPGNLDSFFANNGVGVYTIDQQNSPAYQSFSLLQPDGKLIIGGAMGKILSLVRITKKGEVDSSFGTDGKILGNRGDKFVYYRAGLLQPDGKIIVGGEIEDALYILRFNSNGTPDKTFNKTGELIVSFEDQYDHLSSLVLQPNGKIIVAGSSDAEDLSTSKYGIIRLKANGIVDSTFGIDGKQLFTFEGYDHNVCNTVVLQPDGKIIMAGESYGTVQHDFSAARLDINGSLDNTFSGDGRAVVSVSNSENDAANCAAIQPNGKILLGGYVYINTHYSTLAAVRLTEDGMPDINFDTDGIVTVDVSLDGRYSQASSIALQGDNKILLSGYCSTANGSDYGIIRLKPNGSLDTTFDADGKQVISILLDDYAGSMNLYNDKIILSGSSSTSHPPFTEKTVEPLPTYRNRYTCLRLNENGSLDPLFNGSGKVIVKTGSLNDEANASFIDPDGNILVCGHSLTYFGSTSASLIRLNTNGKVDNSLNGTGEILIDHHGSSQNFNAGVLQSNGKMLLAGSSLGNNSNFFIGRFKPNGIIDSSFGEEGFNITDIKGNDTVTSIAVQFDGKILVAGCSDGGLNNTVITVMRLTAKGIADSSFNGTGIKTISIGALKDAKANAIAIQTNGKILIAGFASPDLFNGKQFVVIRLNTDGTFDNTFDGDGKAYIDLSNGEDVCYSMQLQDDGKIVLAGTSGSGSNNDFAVVRLKANGTPDNSFNGTGRTIIPVGTLNDVARSIAVQPNGKIIVAGYSYNGIDNDAAIIRLNANGGLDSSFDNEGKAIFNYAGTDEKINSVNIQPDGKIVIAGLQKPLNEGFSSTYFVMRIKGRNSFFAGLQNAAEKNTNVSLSQNIPNPFSTTTIINYQLQQKFSSAQIIITDQNGNILKHVNVLDAGKGMVNIDGAMLPSGAYRYSLIIDGKLIDTKKMILVK